MIAPHYTARQDLAARGCTRGIMYAHARRRALGADRCRRTAFPCLPLPRRPRCGLLSPTTSPPAAVRRQRTSRVQIDTTRKPPTAADCAATEAVPGVLLPTATDEDRSDVSDRAGGRGGGGWGIGLGSDDGDGGEAAAGRELPGVPGLEQPTEATLKG
eukprot:7384055-Prymnesium_polylepis.1